MIDAFTIKGLSGNISAEMLLTRAFDKEHDHCEHMIFMHGYLSRMLVKHGYAVFRFDFDGYGKSDGAQQENTVPRMIEDAKVQSVTRFVVHMRYRIQRNKD